MSLKRNCDICGIVIDDNADKVYSDLAIFAGANEKPMYEFEDLCDKCLSHITDAIESVINEPLTEDFPALPKHSKDLPKRGVQLSNGDTVKIIYEDTSYDDAIKIDVQEQQPTATPIPSSMLKQSPAPKEAEPELANGVTNQFQMNSLYERSES